MKNYPKYIAYDAAANEYEHFESVEEAKEWILEQDWSDGFPPELIDGDYFIAKITHRSTVKIIDSKENYGEEWPYDKDWIGDPCMILIEEGE